MFNGELNKETINFVYKNYACFGDMYIKRKFQKIDAPDPETKEHSGFVSYEQMSHMFRTSSLLTTKESNSLLRNYVMKYGYDKIPYGNMTEDFISTRMNLLNNRTTAIHVEMHSKDSLLQGVASSLD